MGQAASGSSVISGTGITVVIGSGQAHPSDALYAAVKACEMERPGLALGDVRGDGSWSFKTYDDTVWPFVYRCMKAHGYQAYGTDFSETSNFGQR